MQVFDIEDIKGLPTATVARPRDCTMCRECIRKEGWEEGRVELKRQANHFIFSVESVGILKPEVIVREVSCTLTRPIDCRTHISSLGYLSSQEEGCEISQAGRGV
jgi:DNA-directed RNA polymerases I and III subunit RPAC1